MVGAVVTLPDLTDAMIITNGVKSNLHTKCKRISLKELPYFDELNAVSVDKNVQFIVIS